MFPDRRFLSAALAAILAFAGAVRAEESPPEAAAAPAARSWVFLKDGRVGRAEAGAEPLKVTFQDGATEEVAADKVKAVRTEEDVAAAVDAAVSALSARLDAKEPRDRLAELKAAALPRLLFHLGGAGKNARMAALAGLNASWTSLARRPVIEALSDKDQDVRNAAAGIVRERVSRQQLCEMLPGLFDARNWPLAVPVFELAEQKLPDVARMAKVLAMPQFHATVMERYLPRYATRELTAGTLKLLDSPDASVRRAAVLGLIHQNDASEPTRSRIAALLADADADLREMAAEYLLWHGSASELPALEAAAGKEQDPYTLSALRAAAGIIPRRAKVLVGSGLRPDLLAEVPAPKEYDEALLLLRTSPGERSRREALELYRNQEPFDPVLIYDGRDPERDAARQRPARMKLAGELFAFPGRLDALDGRRPAEVPEARSFLPPVRDYLDPRRKSFGLYEPRTDTTFGNSVHVGDDAAWFRDQRTVVAVADGVVRRVRWSYSWGCLVVVEHKLPDGTWCCALYGHMSPAVCAAPGETVKKGQKLGSVGRSRTWENGGYWSHLHFGIHRGPFEDDEAGTGWMCGYVGKERFDAGESGWLDPQKFIEERMEEKG